MSRLATSFVLGYHGCDATIADKAVRGEIDLLHSDKSYDWLGPGAYFWESDPKRAREWAESKVAEGQYATAAVVGAVIDLRNCLDLTNRDDIVLLEAAHASFMALQKAAGGPIPANKTAKRGGDVDRSLRFLDCAVLRHLHSVVDADKDLEPYDTIRGIFSEGGELYVGSGFQKMTHTQIAVRENACILGIFYPRPSC